ncbi:MAG TPA: IclR family transcriptional regulator [Trueperaceae bacterium]|nr:IclR family transcriptional regulator [Trueperaceae bacterium]
MSAKPTNPALKKAMIVLEALASGRRPLRFTDLLASTGMAKGSLHRQLAVLQEERLVFYDEPTRTYELGIRLLALTYDSDGTHAIRRFAAPSLEALGQETAETVHLAVLDGAEVIYVSKVESTQKVRMYSDVGLRAPVYCTGVGKALLAFRSAGEQQRIIQRIEFQRYTDSTITSAEQFKDELRLIAERGYALDQSEHETDIRCVAAPIIGPRGESVASISISAPAYREQASREEWIELVTRAAKSVSQRMVRESG